MLEIIIEELSTGRIFVNETFSQDSDIFCNDALKCTITHGLVNEEFADLYYRVIITAFLDNLPIYCNVPLNYYMEIIRKFKTVRIDDL